MFNKVNVELLEYTRQADEFDLGNQMIFTKISDLKGYFDFLNSNDKFLQDQYRNVATHVFVCLNVQVPALSGENYLKFKGEYYKILYVDYPVQARQTEIICKKEVV